MLLFLAMIIAPCVFYFYLAHSDWSWLYLVDPKKVPRLAVIPLLAAEGAALVGGYYGASKLVRAGKELALRITLGSFGGVLLVLVLILRKRLVHYGTYSQFRAGQALPLLDVKLGYVLIAVFVGAGAAAAVVAYELTRDGKRAVAR